MRLVSSEAVIYREPGHAWGIYEYRLHLQMVCEDQRMGRFHSPNKAASPVRVLRTVVFAETMVEISSNTWSVN